MRKLRSRRNPDPPTEWFEHEATELRAEGEPDLANLMEHRALSHDRDPEYGSDDYRILYPPYADYYDERVAPPPFRPTRNPIGPLASAFLGGIGGGAGLIVGSKAVNKLIEAGAASGGGSGTESGSGATVPQEGVMQNPIPYNPWLTPQHIETLEMPTTNANPVRARYKQGEIVVTAREHSERPRYQITKVVRKRGGLFGGGVQYELSPVDNREPIVVPEGDLRVVPGSSGYRAAVGGGGRRGRGFFNPVDEDGVIEGEVLSSESAGVQEGVSTVSNPRSKRTGRFIKRSSAKRRNPSHIPSDLSIHTIPNDLAVEQQQYKLSGPAVVAIRAYNPAGGGEVGHYEEEVMEGHNRNPVYGRSHQRGLPTLSNPIDIGDEVYIARLNSNGTVKGISEGGFFGQNKYTVELDGGKLVTVSRKAVQALNPVIMQGVNNPVTDADFAAGFTGPVTASRNSPGSGHAMELYGERGLNPTDRPKCPACGRSLAAGRCRYCGFSPYARRCLYCKKGIHATPEHAALVRQMSRNPVTDADFVQGFTGPVTGMKDGKYGGKKSWNLPSDAPSVAANNPMDRVRLQWVGNVKGHSLRHLFRCEEHNLTAQEDRMNGHLKNQHGVFSAADRESIIVRAMGPRNNPIIMRNGNNPVTDADFAAGFTGPVSPSWGEYFPGGRSTWPTGVPVGHNPGEGVQSKPQHDFAPGDFTLWVGKYYVGNYGVRRAGAIAAAKMMAEGEGEKDHPFTWSAMGLHGPITVRRGRAVVYTADRRGHNPVQEPCPGCGHRLTPPANSVEFRCPHCHARLANG